MKAANKARAKIIAVAGGSGSGKTTLVKRLTEQVPGDAVMVLHTDNYYLDLAQLSVAERNLRNFDHPDAFDVPLMIEHVRDLLAGRDIARPTYDFATHTRKSGGSVTLSPAPIIVVDGILSLHWPELRQLFDLKVFVEVDDDVRFIRRLRRDVSERGRTPESVVQQYLGSVKGMHDLYCAPQKYSADIIVSWMEYNDRAVSMLAGMMRSWVAEP